jgi:hypothetical protein
LRPIKRAAEDDKTTLVDGTMNANSATKPGMMPIKNLAETLVGASIVFLMFTGREPSSSQETFEESLERMEHHLRDA